MEHGPTANRDDVAGIISDLKAKLPEEDRPLLDGLLARLTQQVPPGAEPRASGSVRRPSAAQWRVLEMLGGHDARGIRPTVTDMAAALGFRRQSVTSHLKAMGRAGLVRRVAHGDWVIEPRGAAGAGRLGPGQAPAADRSPPRTIGARYPRGHRVTGPIQCRDSSGCRWTTGRVLGRRRRPEKSLPVEKLRIRPVADRWSQASLPAPFPLVAGSHRTPTQVAGFDVTGSGRF